MTSTLLDLNSSFVLFKRPRKMCYIKGCVNQSQVKGLCRSHGGIRECQVPECKRAIQLRGRCHMHGGKRLCRIPECTKKDRGRGREIYHNV